MGDRPEELEVVDRYLLAAEYAHEYAFGVHRQLVGLAADPDRSRKLLAESAAIALQQLPALTRHWRTLEHHWFEVELLDPSKLGPTTQALTAHFAELGPALKALRLRQDEIVAELVELLNNARPV